MAGNATPKGSVEFGSQLLQYFTLDPTYHNLNHGARLLQIHCTRAMLRHPTGSFGSTPRKIQKQLQHYQEQFEARPDIFTRYELPKLLDENRAAVAQLLNAPVNTLVFVTNATVGVNTVLRNIMWNEDLKDEILSFNTIYGACGKTIDYIVDSNNGRVASREITLTYPCEDEEVVQAFRNAVCDSKAAGKRPRICVFDTVSSLPGVRFPFKEITTTCKEFGILSLIDGAQGIGQIKIDLEAVDPDFFVTNLHKWLHVPRSCAAFYVPVRNQGLIASTVPTSHGYVPKTRARFNPLPPPGEGKSAFENNFEFIGTMDTSAYLCAKHAIEWREEVLGGEDKIIEYTNWLAAEGGRKAADILGTTIMENTKGTLTKCTLVNVALPMWVRPAANLPNPSQPFEPPSDEIILSSEEALGVGQWMLQVLMNEYNTFVALFIHNNRVWVRLSAQVYLDLRDFDWAGRTLLDVCKRVAKKEYNRTGSL